MKVYFWTISWLSGFPASPNPQGDLIGFELAIDSPPDERLSMGRSMYMDNRQPPRLVIRRLSLLPFLFGQFAVGCSTALFHDQLSGVPRQIQPHLFQNFQLVIDSRNWQHTGIIKKSKSYEAHTTNEALDKLDAVLRVSPHLHYTFRMLK